MTNKIIERKTQRIKEEKEDKILVSRVLEKNNIIVEHNLNLIKINGENELESLIFENTQTKEIKEFKTKGCFIAIGQIPQNEIFKELVDLNKGFIITNEKMETKTSGLYAIGDCKDKLLRQLTTKAVETETKMATATSIFLTIRS